MNKPLQASIWEHGLAEVKNLGLILKKFQNIKIKNAEWSQNLEGPNFST